jgi:hypothetical protein
MTPTIEIEEPLESPRAPYLRAVATIQDLDTLNRALEDLCRCQDGPPRAYIMQDDQATWYRTLSFQVGLPFGGADTLLCRVMYYHILDWVGQLAAQQEKPTLYWRRRPQIEDVSHRVSEVISWGDVPIVGDYSARFMSCRLCIPAARGWIPISNEGRTPSLITREFLLDHGLNLTTF